MTVMDVEFAQGPAGAEAWPVEVTNLQGLKPYSQVLTADDTLTPTSGTRLVLLKTQVIANPFNTGANLVQFILPSIDADPFLQGWVFSSSAEWIGDVDEPLQINLSNAEQVSVNIQYKEIP